MLAYWFGIGVENAEAGQVDLKERAFSQVVLWALMRVAAGAVIAAVFLLLLYSFRHSAGPSTDQDLAVARAAASVFYETEMPVSVLPAPGPLPGDSSSVDVAAEGHDGGR
jgi:hypothetical protein